MYALVTVGMMAGATVRPGALVMAAAEPVAPVLIVTDAGDSSTAVDLTPTASVGSTADVHYFQTASGSIDGGGSAELIDESVTIASGWEISAAATDGGSTVIDTITSVDPVADGSGDAFLLASRLAPLVGTSIRRTIDAQGATTDVTSAPDEVLTAEQQGLVDELRADIGANATVLPDSPVGVGATWTVEQPAAIDGIDLTALYTYSLDSIDGDSATITFQYSVDAASGERRAAR